jgi:glycerol-3-phosphate dehydrogenase
MASRGWRDIHLVEKDVLGYGTSSRSTKLIHGGLRYLKHIRDFGLVTEALRERHRLLSLVPDLVHPLEMLFPILKKGGMPRLMVKAGLTLYDRLAGKYALEPHRWVDPAEAFVYAPNLNLEKFSTFYAFSDCQTDDLGLVRRIAASAKKLGAGITEGCTAKKITMTDDGWDVEMELASGQRKVVSALYLVNALGPWANALLEGSSIKPTHNAINNRGAHLLLRDMGLKVGLFLQSSDDHRIFFLLPWKGHTLLGTTEEIFSGDPDDLVVRPDEIEYLLERCNSYLVTPLKTDDIVATFAGLRWLAVEEGSNISDTSRAYVVGERTSKRGLLMTLYGGKLTTYRSLAETIGDRLTAHFGEFRNTKTDDKQFWATAEEAAVKSFCEETLTNRFTEGKKERTLAI